jgi:hypothetical protein
MKHLAFFLLWGCLPCPSQALDILSRRIDLSIEKMPLQNALEEVSREGHFAWSYNPGILPDHPPPVSLTAKDWTVRETLYAILGQGYTFKSNGNYLIIKKLEKPNTSLSGYLRNAGDGSRVANATIYDKKTLRAVTTDSSGYYELKIKKATEIVVARLGYRDTTFVVTPTSPRFQPLSLSLQTPLQTEPTPQQALQLALSHTASRIERFFDATIEKWHEINVPRNLHRRFQVSVLPGVGTNHRLSRKVANDWSLNLIAGQSAAVRKAELAGMLNFTQGGVKGIQAAGVSNLVRGSCRGVQAAGIYNQVLDTLSGVQLGGIFNVARKTNGSAIQTAGIFNYTAGSPEIQIAGILNRASASKGLQIAGLLNTTDQSEGIQIAGLLNMANEMKGTQAGVVNKAGRVRGVQIGLVNTTKSLKGVQIGLFNKSGSRKTFLVNVANSK